MAKGRAEGVGVVTNGWLVKTVLVGNILRNPEPSFTVDKYVYLKARARIIGVRILCGEVIYELRTPKFDLFKIEYNYGNGANYRIPITSWDKVPPAAKFVQMKLGGLMS